MRRVVPVLAALALARAAHADPAPPVEVNLLKVAPTVVAVSSTVANGAYLPEHLVDGDLSTAWNSATGEEHAWIAVRVPAGAHVTAIKLTAGFTRKDRSGDLFTMNPRIHVVRVTRGDGKLVGAFELAVDKRDLQTLAVDLPGGDFTIRVDALQPGTKPTWRETCVSELQVWGTLPPLAAAVPSKPVVRIGSLDALPAPSPAECLRLVHPDAAHGRIGPDTSDPQLTGWGSLGLGRDLAVCRIDAQQDGAADTTTELVAMRRAPKGWKRVGPPLQTTTTREHDPAMQVDTEGSVELSLVPLTTSETAVRIDTLTDRSGPMYGAHHRHSVLARLTAAGLVSILEIDDGGGSGEASDSDTCTLADVVPTAAMPVLRFDCVHTEGRWHHEDPRGDGEFSTNSVQTFVWTGQAYAQKPAP